MRKLIYIAFLLIGTVLMAATGSDTLTPSQKREKARYYYMEGVRLQAEDKGDEAYEMFKHALRIDPDYAEAASAYGMGRLYINNDSLQTPDAYLDALGYMRPFVDKYPGDIQESVYYAYLASQLDTAPEAVRIFERVVSLYPDKTDVLLRLADAYVRMDSVKKAVEALSRYEAVEGKSFPLSSRKVSFLLGALDTVGALREAESFISYNPKDLSGYIMKGAIYENISKPDSALVYYLKAEEMEPDAGRTKVMLANFYRGINDSVKFDEYTYGALLSEEFDLEQKLAILTDYVRTLLQNKSDYSRGDYLFDVLNSQYPYEPKVLDLAARYNYEKGDVEKAMELISRAIDMKPDEEDYYGSLMSYQIDRDRYKDALATYHRAEEYLTPGEGLKFIYASAATQVGEYDAAAKELQILLDEIIPGAPIFDSLPLNNEVRSLDFNDLMRASVIYGMLGDMYYQAKDAQKSFGAYENAVRLMPLNYMTLNNYAYFLAQEGKDLEKAQKLSKDAVDANPDNPTFLDTYAYILFLKKQYPEALEYQQKAISNTETNKRPEAELYNHLGDILYFLDRKEEAVDNWKKALELDKDNQLIKKKIDTGEYYPENN